jgi:hypothetical protein
LPSGRAAVPVSVMSRSCPRRGAESAGPVGSFPGMNGRSGLKLCIWFGPAPVHMFGSPPPLRQKAAPVETIG